MYQNCIKRVLDLICAASAMLVFSWLYVILAILVRVKLGSPVIFKQKRPGKDEKIFELCKFRSMSNAKDKNGNLLPDAQRLTRFGRILRSTSLDELPEAWNILKGDMSVVGPRPWAVSYLKYFTPEEHRRHEVRPGLTGSAQVHGRTAANWDERLKYDLEYVDHVTFFNDLKIIALTVKKFVMREDIVEAGCQGDFSDYRESQWKNGTVPKPDNI
jgi:lipopolysaccharide/colanic/teichoic acid biosynthesis glycosyltransferase